MKIAGTRPLIAPALLMFLLLQTSPCPAVVARAQRATGYTANPPAVAATVYVKPDGNDNADGSSLANAVKTLTNGVSLASAKLKLGTSTKISIAPGIYREGGIRISSDQIGGSSSGTLLVIEGAEKGKVVISGSVRQGWDPATWKLIDSAKVIYEHSWPYAWPMSGLPPGEGASYTDLLRHREMIFHNGILLRQYLSLSGLTASKCTIDPLSAFGNIIGGRFFVNDTTKMAYIQLPQPLSAGDSIEVAEKGILLWIEPKTNVIVRNLVFTHSNDYIWQNSIWGSATRFSPHGSAALIEDCDFRYNNSSGSELFQAQASSYRGCTFSNNGWRGLGSVDNIVVESCRADSNSWRQFWGRHTGLDAGGIKCGVSGHITICRFGSVGGTSEALWFDCGNTHITMDQCTIPQYQPSAIMLEANPGPITVLKSVVSWVVPIGTSNVVYDSCTFARGLSISDQNFRTVGGYTAVNQNYGVYHCTIVINGPGYTWDAGSKDPDIWSRFFGSLDADYNTWIWNTKYAYTGDRLFYNQSKTAITFAQWQALGKDVHSTFQPPTAIIPRQEFAEKRMVHHANEGIVYSIAGRRAASDFCSLQSGSRSGRKIPQGIYLITSRDNTGTGVSVRRFCSVP